MYELLIENNTVTKIRQCRRKEKLRRGEKQRDWERESEVPIFRKPFERVN